MNHNLPSHEVIPRMKEVSGKTTMNLARKRQGAANHIQAAILEMNKVLGKMKIAIILESHRVKSLINNALHFDNQPYRFLVDYRSEKSYGIFFD